MLKPTVTVPFVMVGAAGGVPFDAATKAANKVVNRETFSVIRWSPQPYVRAQLHEHILWIERPPEQ